MTTAAKARHIPIRPEWLAQHVEAPIEPDFPIIDAHHHLWDKPGARYLFEEMAADLASGHNVVATISAEGKTGFWTGGPEHLRPAGETEMIAALAQRCVAETGSRVRIAAGIVGYVDLSVGQAAGDALDRHAEVSGGRLRGIRDTSAWHADPEARGSVILPPPGKLYDPGFRRGLAELTRRNLVFDAWMYHTQLNELADLAHAAPDTRFVLNHQGGPIGIGPYAGRRAEVFDDWLYFMKKLAGFDNISVKLGGFGMLMSGFPFAEHPVPADSSQLADAWAPYMRACIELFGAARCMFESNFPVDKGTASYCTVWNAFKKIVADGSPTERHELFFGCANRTYGLGLELDETIPRAAGSEASGR
ncbi:amidohydrolase family protein [Aquibium sp. LZ166]|uniref:Amidohydrolase family protein n=1 Tax=Aquibium pacificus TaxID=3153579 RepID=A0ABV3SJ93_9HYPH